jgi:hypothetical protein
MAGALSGVDGMIRIDAMLRAPARAGAQGFRPERSWLWTRACAGVRVNAVGVRESENV